MDYNDAKRYVLKIISNKKYQWIATIIVLFAILMMSSSIRVSNWDLLTDSTTGEKIPLALDPFYFLRVSETIVENNGILPEFDEMRSPSLGVGWHAEILPKVVVIFYYISNFFNLNIPLQDIGIGSPVIFFIIGTIIFFFLSYILSEKKSVALIATAILAFSSSYLYRTMAGFSDHEAIGMVALFSFFLIYSLALKNFEKSWIKTFVYSILSGVMIVFVLATWGGATTFVLTVMPFAFFMYWIFNEIDELKAISFYGFVILSSLLSTFLFGYSPSDMSSRFMGSYGLLVPFVFMFILIDFGLSKIRVKRVRDLISGEHRLLYSLGATAALGLIGLQFIGRNIFIILKDVWDKLINPFGSSGRLGSTVAENSQPFLLDWIGQSGQIIFWLFVLGALIAGINIGISMKTRRNKVIFIASWIFVVSGILFSRISSGSVFNGSNFISQSFYLLGLVLFGIALFIAPSREKFTEIKTSNILILAILFFTLINGRSATRVFFLIAPFVSFSAAYSIGRLYDYAKKSKEEISRVIIWSLFIIAVAGVVFSINTDYSLVSNQAKYTGPSANTQWQKAMEWTRNNTGEKDIFIHWWDYGYWIQSLGKRPTVTDGGHSGGYQADHYIGRYVLTTPNPESALSYMKTWNVSYLLIDQSDLGKYPAYSKIGGGAEDELDRYSAIPVMLADEKQTRETSSGVMIAFTGGMYLFEDVIYNDGNKNIFLPSGKAAIVGIIVNLDGNHLKQPEVVYMYNNIQTRIPARYVYINNEIVDFGSGLDVVIDIIPSFTGNGINQMGAAIYLSQKVSKGLFARLYLLDGAFNDYETLKLAHVEDDQVVASLKSQGVNLGDFIYYQGFRGPIKIWDVEYSDDIRVIKEFKDDLGGEYARFDEVFY